MRCYKVSVVTSTVKAERYAGTNADATAQKKKFIDQLGVTKKDVHVDDCEVPDDKDGKLAFINKLAARLDQVK